MYYWRDKQKHEVDFVVKPVRGRAVHAIECKSNYKSFDAGNLKAFRHAYPHGENFLYAANVSEPMALSCGGLSVMALPVGTRLTNIK